MEPGRPRKWVATGIRGVVTVFASGVFLVGVLPKNSAILIHCFGLLARGSSHLKGSSGKHLTVGVEVLVIGEKDGKEPVGTVDVVPGPEHINDYRGEVVNFGGGYACRFDPVKCRSIDFGGCDFRLRLHTGWAVPKPFKLLNRVVPSFVDGWTLQRGAGSEIGPQVTKILDDLNGLHYPPAASKNPSQPSQSSQKAKKSSQVKISSQKKKKSSQVKISSQKGEKSSQAKNQAKKRKKPSQVAKSD